MCEWRAPFPVLYIFREIIDSLATTPPLDKMKSKLTHAFSIIP